MESLSDTNPNKDTKEPKIMRIEDTRKSGTERKGVRIGIKTTQIADMATVNQSTREIGTMEISKITSTVDQIIRTTNTETATLTSKGGSTAENKDTEDNSKTTDTMIDEELSSIRITQTSSLQSLDMMTKKASQRSTSWAKELPINSQNQGTVTTKISRQLRVLQRPIPSYPNGSNPPSKNHVSPSPQSQEETKLIPPNPNPRLFQLKAQTRSQLNQSEEDWYVVAEEQTKMKND